MPDGVASSSLATPVPRRSIVFPDPVAFRFLEEDACVQIVEHRSVMRGYELYLVEQWACSRKSPTLVIATYTGDETHSITVGVLAVPEDEALWSARLHIYLKAAQQHHARPKATDLGELLVTNLSSFPSALTVIPVPDGDVRKHRQLFIVNEDLKRLGCSGRSGLTLTDPTEATQAKFHQLYRTSDRIPFLQSVAELIKLCQVALYMFEKLDTEYIDGLLCDVTETAIADWWTEVGAEHYNFEPTDGILGPSTVAALLGMLMGARNRLHWYGAPVSKDVFDIENTKRGVAYFQKQQKLDKTRRLDRQTLFRLHTATAKAASGEGWGVQKAVKSTVSEIGGKRGEIVMDMVSGRDKGGLADIETLDIDRFANLAYGERPKWLWHGKARRTHTEHADYDQELGGTVLIKHDTAGQAAKRTQSLPLEEDLETRKKEDGTAPYSTFPPGPPTSIADNAGDRDALRRNVFKSVAGKMNDARSGLGRIKDAVGGSRRGHASRPSASAKEDFWESGNTSAVAAGAAQASALASSPAVVSSAFPLKNMPEEYLAGIRRGDADALPRSSNDYRDASASLLDSKIGKKPTDERSSDLESTLDNIGTEIRKDMLPQSLSRARPMTDENDLQGPFLDAERRSEGRQLAVSRRHSCGVSDLAHKHAMNENRWARRMSFGDAEPAILTWTEIVDIMDTTGDVDLYGARADGAEHLGRLIDGIMHDAKPWVEEKMKMVELLNERYVRHSSELQNLYQQLNEACQRVRHNSDELLAVERGSLGESIKEIEVLFARLEYEIDSLVQKVHDVEDGIQNFERQVDGVEKRAEQLKLQLETESWLHWFVRTLTGVGTGPNITRETG
ncbi:Sin3 complex subunit (Stb2) [Hirsutella rhossiliensis]|uniref:Sin3 complex subunit (Stb2) n=1 Tax=Hirsutella rhossiliensis TaxID=111463 RepID=A0A9P8MW77_9HYPO|nr:Sin3 complex subunit (Stb2) [Hirsutella rhossiliensis]KAH0962370.1 Sin3 complex subunit (Stb2) [Hirsutella rhossiliensis]